MPTNSINDPKLKQATNRITNALASEAVLVLSQSGGEWEIQEDSCTNTTYARLIQLDLNTITALVELPPAASLMLKANGAEHWNDHKTRFPKGIREKIEKWLNDDPRKSLTIESKDGFVKWEITLDKSDRLSDAYGKVIDSDSAAGEVSPLPRINPPKPESLMPFVPVPDKKIAHFVMKDPSPVLERIDQFNAELDELHAPIIDQVQQFLHSLEGYSFGSLENNEEFATKVQMLLNRLSQRIACTRDDCNQPALLDCRDIGGTKTGTFQLRHKVKGLHTSHSSSISFHKADLCKAPPTVSRYKKKKRKK